MRRLLRSVGLLVVGMCIVLAASALESRRDDDVQAEVIYNLMLFIDWPGKPTEMRLCAVVDGELLHALERQRGKLVHGIALDVIPLVASDGVENCSVVFIESGRPGLIERAAVASRRRPLLVMAAGDNALARGAMIGLVDNGGKFGFDISMPALKRSGLSASSKLLRLARVRKERDDD
jgi:hypothetical protein